MKKMSWFSASAAFALFLGTSGFAQHYKQTNLVSNTSGAAPITDPQLMNAWGLSRGSGSAWWVSDQTAGVSTLYNGNGAKQSLIVTIPPADPTNKNTPIGSPTGTIFNGSQNDFLLAAGKPAVFLFCTGDGTIAGWNPTVAVDQGAMPPSTHAVTVVRTTDGSAYTGLTSAFVDGRAYLYAANFSKGRIDIYDSGFQRAGGSKKDSKWDSDDDNKGPFSRNAFSDERLPRHYVPFNV